MANILHTVSTQLIGDNCEALAFSDGHVEVEDPARNFEDTPSLPHILLDKEQARELRDFLNGLDL